MCTIDKAISSNLACSLAVLPKVNLLMAFARYEMRTHTQLLIKGVRSFSPENQGVIEFYKPLTLIVGHNGAGKTVPPLLPISLNGVAH